MPALSLPAWTGQYADRRVFVCWGWRRTRAGKVTKPPLMPSGALASSTDQSTWITLADALKGLEGGTMDGKPLHGIGMVLTTLEDLFARDLDHCNDGQLVPWAQ